MPSNTLVSIVFSLQILCKYQRYNFWERVLLSAGKQKIAALQGTLKGPLPLGQRHFNVRKETVRCFERPPAAAPAAASAPPSSRWFTSHPSPRAAADVPLLYTEEPAASPHGLWRPVVPRLIVWHGASRVKEHGEETQESEYVAFGGAPGVAFGGAPSVAQPSSSPAVGPGKGLGKAAPFPRPPCLHIRSGCQPLAATLPVRSLTVTPLPLGKGRR